MMAPGTVRGFTVVELIVTIVLLTSIAAVVTPAVVGALDARRVRVAARALEDLARAVHDPDSTAGSFRADVGRYPGALEHLTRQITIADANGCGIAYRPGDIIPEKWRGTYVNRVIDDAGVPIGIGTAMNQMTRDDPSNVRNSRMRIHVTGVAPEDAAALDARIDLGDGGAGGTIRWDPGAADSDGFVTVDYLIQVAGC